MKATQITHRDQLVGGQLYIRAYVNYMGDPGVDVIRVNGKPGRYKRCPFMDGRQLWDVSVTDIYSRGDGRARHTYTTDLGADDVTSTNKALYRFTPELCAHLKTLAAQNRIGLLEFIRGQQISEEDRREILADWYREEQMEKQMEKHWHWITPETRIAQTAKSPADAITIVGWSRW